MTYRHGKGGLLDFILNFQRRSHSGPKKSLGSITSVRTLTLTWHVTFEVKEQHTGYHPKYGPMSTVSD